MKQIIPWGVGASLVLGTLFTILYTSQSRQTTIPKCTAAVIENDKQTSTAQMGSCAVVERGFPAKFLTSDISINIQKNVGNTLSQRDIDITAMPRYNLRNLVLDWVLWTFAAAIVFVVLPVVLLRKPKSRPTNTSTAH